VRWRRGARIGLTLAVTGLCCAYILTKIDLGTTADVAGEARLAYVLLALAITLAAFPVNAWRWQLLLRAQGIHDNMGWLTRAYLVSYTAGQVLPSSLGADAVRIYETARRHPGNAGVVAGSILLERALGAVATLVLAAIGLLLAVGRYDVGIYIWIVLAFVVLAILAGVILFSRGARPLLRRTTPLLRRIWVERQVRVVYEAIHRYRDNVTLLIGVTAITLVVQAAGVLAIWASAKAVGIDLSPRPYYVMGPLLVLLVLIPFTVSGLGVRESFFVSFLGELAVGANEAFSAGLIFFVVIIAAAVPGFLIWGVEVFIRRADRAPVVDRGAREYDEFHD
jgi:hypothetical protein